MMTTMTQNTTTRPSMSFARNIGVGLGHLHDTLSTWYRRYHERRHLLTLDDRMLKDIGLSRADIELEARKPFWLE